MQQRAARILASAPKIPLLGALIKSGVGLTGLLLAIMGYESTLAIFGGLAIAMLAWTALYRREGQVHEQDEWAEEVAGIEERRFVVSGSGEPTALPEC